MDGLKYFILGFVAVYGIQIFDILLNILNSYSAILITKCQVKINELGGGEETGDPYAIGFQCYDQEDYESEGDYVD